MNARVLFTLIAAASALPAWADVPPVDDIGRPAMVRCRTVVGGGVIAAVHTDKIIFSLSGALVAANAADQAALNAVPRDTELDIKVLDDPRTVADLRGKVLSFIGALDNPQQRQGVKIIDVEYAMVCPNVQQPPQD